MGGGSPGSSVWEVGMCGEVRRDGDRNNNSDEDNDRFGDNDSSTDGIPRRASRPVESPLLALIERSIVQEALLLSEEVCDLLMVLEDCSSNLDVPRAAGSVLTSTVLQTVFTELLGLMEEALTVLTTRGTASGDADLETTMVTADDQRAAGDTRGDRADPLGTIRELAASGWREPLVVVAACLVTSAVSRTRRRGHPAVRVSFGVWR